MNWEARYIPEYAIADLVHFPCSDKGNVSRNGRLKHISPTRDFPRLFLYSWDFDTSGYPSWVIANRDVTLFHGSRGSCGCVKRRYPSSLGADTLSQGALGYEFEGDFALEIQGFKFLVTVSLFDY